MEKLCQIKDTLITLVEQQMANPQCVNTHEMGEVIDMIKDLAEACYYGSVVDAMLESKEEEEIYGIGMMKDPRKRKNPHPYYTNGDYREDKYYTKDYDGGYNGYSYTGTGGMNDDNKKMGHSPMKRKSYIESKERHMDQALQMRELEDYAQVLTSDLMEMIQDATPEEKQLLQRKIATLATKIV